MQSRKHRKVQPKVNKKNFGDLVDAENKKTDAILQLSQELARSNEIKEKSNELKAEELQLHKEGLLIQEKRNEIFQEINSNVIAIANAFLEILNK